MKASQLIFECVRDCIAIPNGGLSYFSFTKKVAGNEPLGKDWELQFSSVFSALNMGFSRLSSYDRIPYMVEESVNVANGRFSFNKGTVINAVVVDGQGKYKSLTFKTLRPNEYFIIGKPTITKIWVEYRPFIPHFDIGETCTPEWRIKEATAEKDENKDLSELGINQIMCDYLKEFVKAQTMLLIDPYISDALKNTAEQYMAQVPVASTSFSDPMEIENVQQGWF